MRRPAIHVLNPRVRGDSMVVILYSLTFAVVTAVLTIFCAPSFSADNTENVSEYVIGPGDVIQVSVWQYEQFNSTTTVGPDGKITVNMLGDIPIAGLTREEARKDIGSRLLKFLKTEAEVTVSIVQFNSQKISVFGRVTNPRIITFSSIPSLMEVIMVQSIPAPDADLTAIKIIPADPSIGKPVTVNLLEALEKGDPSLLPKLHPGDTVYVPKMEIEVSEAVATEAADSVSGTERTAITSQPPGEGTRAEQFVIHVMGAVARPGSLVSDKKLTLTEALLRAGSVTNDIALKYVRVIRGAPTQESKAPVPPVGDRVLHIDLDEYLAKGDASILPKLYSGDTIYVPEVTQGKMKDISILITGEVLRPGSYNTREPLDILDAISMAGGLTTNADPERIRVRKESADSYQEKIVNIDEFLRDVGSTGMPEMVGPGYRIYVPTKHRPTSAVAGAARGLVTFLADVAVVYSLWRVLER